MNNKNIIDSLYSFFPRNIDCYDPKYLQTAEHQHLKDFCSTFETKNQAFLNVLENTDKLSPSVDYTALNAWDRCYRMGTHISAEIGLVTSISIIAPFYIFQTHINDGSQKKGLDLAYVPEEMLKQISVIIEEFYPGYSLLDRNIWDIRISDISLPRSEFGEVTLAKAIFTDHTI